VVFWGTEIGIGSGATKRIAMANDTVGTTYSVSIIQPATILNARSPNKETDIDKLNDLLLAIRKEFWE